MSKNDFILKYTYPVDSKTLYTQFATAEGVHHWWTRNCQMEEKVGGRARFPFPDADFYAIATVTRLEPDQCVEWEITESRHPEKSGWADLHDWEGTHIRFEINSIDENQSRLQFTHIGLGPLECAESCSSLWQFYLNQSLRKYLETGKGKPYKDDQT